MSLLHQIHVTLLFFCYKLPNKKEMQQERNAAHLTTAFISFSSSDASMNSWTVLLSTLSCSNKRWLEREMQYNALSSPLCEPLPLLCVGAFSEIEMAFVLCEPWEVYSAHAKQTSSPCRFIMCDKYLLYSCEQTTKALASGVFAVVDFFEFTQAVQVKTEWKVVMVTDQFLLLAVYSGSHVVFLTLVLLFCHKPTMSLKLTSQTYFQALHWSSPVKSRHHNITEWNVLPSLKKPGSPLEAKGPSNLLDNDSKHTQLAREKTWDDSKLQYKCFCAFEKGAGVFFVCCFFCVCVYVWKGQSSKL